MLNDVLRFALNNRAWVLGGVLAMVIYGVIGLGHLPVDAVPDITPIHVVVNTKTGALDPEKIEMLVTRPVEIEMGGLPGLEEVRSISKFGLSQVTLVFQEGTPVYSARQMVLERLQNLRKSLPPSLHPEMGPVTTGLGEVLFYSVEAEPGSDWMKLSEKERLTELRTIQDFKIRPLLKRVAGVADVDSTGGFVKQIHINFFPNRLEKFGLTVESLASRVSTLGENFGGGYIQRQGHQVIVRTVPGTLKLDDLMNVSLGLNIQGKSILLRDVAEVRKDHALRVGAATRQGREVVLGTVLMRNGANSHQVAQDAERELQQMELPSGVKVHLLYSRSYLVNATLWTVSENLIGGALLVILVLFFMLGNLRASMVVACVIPIAMLIATRGMSLLGVSANLMSLGAIDFGLVVDGSVVLIENILRNGRRRSVLESCQEVIKPVSFGLIMIMLVYLPVLSLEGIEGKMFRPMAVTVLLALAAAWVLTLVLTPVLAEMGLHPSEEHEQETALVRGLKKLYLPTLQFVLDHPLKMMIGSILLVVIAVGLVLRMGADFVPRLDEGDMVMSLARDPKISIDESVRVQKESEELTKGYSEVKDVFSRIGTAESATDPMGVQLSDTFVILEKDRSKWNFPTKLSLFKSLQNKFTEKFSDQEVTESQPIEMRFNDILEGSRADVTLRILGNDLDELSRLMDVAKKRVENISGVESTFLDPLTAIRKTPVLNLTPNYGALSRYEVRLSAANETIETSMSGQEVGSFFEGGIRFPMLLHLDESLRDQIPVIESLPIALPQGGTLPVSALYDVALKDQVSTIARYWGERYAAISFNLGDRDISSFVQEAKQRLQQDLKLPEGYRYYWGGQFKNLERARGKLLVVVPLTLVIIFLILARILGSLGQTLLVYSSIPFAGVGGIFTLSLRGMPMSISAAIGFIALMGIALLNSLVLISYFNSHRDEGKELREIVTTGATSRLRPVMMTALVASLGFFPMAINQGVGSEIQRPLATVVMGGLVSSTLLTLIFLPTLYYWLEKRVLISKVVS
jgi:cobalt-zinc-cadmium resistance protein CzcA